MARRLPTIGLVWALAGAGCVFTSRPMIPLDENTADASGTDRGVIGGNADGGRTADTGAMGSDVWVPPPSDASIDASAAADSGAVAVADASAPGDAGGPHFDNCFPVEADGGDGGFQTTDGRPCDPAAVDAGGDVTDAHGDVTDATTDADAPTAGDALGGG